MQSYFAQRILEPAYPGESKLIF